MFRLARDTGEWDVDTMLERMDRRDLIDWMAVYALDADRAREQRVRERGMQSVRKQLRGR